MLSWKGLDILWAYTPSQMPVINWLARNYAVSDQWFCSVPSQTNPNRAFSLCGTSLGRESNLVLVGRRAVRRDDGVQPAGHRRQELGPVLHRRVEGEQVLHRVHLPVDLPGRRQLGDRRHPDVHEAGQGRAASPVHVSRADVGLRQGHALQAGHRLPPADTTASGRAVPGGRVRRDPTGPAVERDAVRGDVRRARRHLRPPSAAEDDQPGITARRLGVQLRPPRRACADDPGVAIRRGRDGLPCARRQRSPLRPHVAVEDAADVGRRRSGVRRHGRPDAGRADLRGCARRRSRERPRRPPRGSRGRRGRARRRDGEPPARGGAVRRDEGDRRRRRRRRGSRGRGQPLPGRPGGVRGVTRPGSG